MKIQYVKIKNIGPFKKVNLSFDDKDVIGIQAQWKNNKRKSNQSGKSFFMETIKWVLTGESRAEKDVELIHHGEEYGEAVVSIGDEEQSHVIRRGKDLKNNSVLEFGSKDKSKEAQDAINKLIGFIPSEFDMTAYFEQEEINSFMKLTPQKKKEHIMRWVENTYWNIPFSNAQRDYLTAQKSLDEVKTKQLYLEEKYESMSHTIKDDILESEAKLVTAKDEMSSLQRKLKKAEKSLKNDSVEDIQEDIKELKNKKIDVSKAINNYKELKSDISDIEGKIASIKISKLKHTEKEVREGIIKLKAKIANLEEKIEKSDELTGMCPILGEACDRIKSSPKKIKEWKDELSNLSDDLDQLEKYMVRIEKQKKNLSKKENLEGKLETLLKVKSKSDIKVLKKSLTDIDDEILSLEKRIKAISSNNESDIIDSINRKIEDKNDEIESLQKEIATLKVLKEQRSKLKKEIKEIQGIIQEQSLHVDDLKYVVFTFGKNGIPSQEVENAFSEIEEEINFVLKEFGTDMQVIFSADRELNDWEKSCVSCGYVFPKGYKKSTCEKCEAAREKKRKDELQIKVTKNGTDYGFYLESGGGKTILSLAIRVALTRLKLRKSGSNFWVLFMDEVDAPLDEENRDSFIALVNNVLLKKLGFTQIFWVSHNKIISDAIPHTLMVTKKGSYSEASFV